LVLAAVPQEKASATAPLGAPTYKPSAERPVGWRGDGTGRFPGANPPLTWSRTREGVRNILWATPLPDSGVSSPIVVNGRVFVTAGYSDLVCIEKQTGRILWIR